MYGYSAIHPCFALYLAPRTAFFRHSPSTFDNFVKYLSEAYVYDLANRSRSLPLYKVMKCVSLYESKQSGIVAMVAVYNLAADIKATLFKRVSVGLDW